METKKYKIEIDPRILELLGPNLYTNIYYVLAELIANAYDADAHNVYIISEPNAIRVEDDGHGIPEQDRARVFEAFARLDDSRTRASGGYGLGLSIVSRIAYWFGGKVEVDQSPNLGGARFTMVWPAKRFRKPRKKAAAEKEKTTDSWT